MDLIMYIMYQKSSVHIILRQVHSLQCWLNTAELSLGHVQVYVRSVTESLLKRFTRHGGYV